MGLGAAGKAEVTGRAASSVWLPWTFRQILAFPHSPWWLAGAVSAGFLVLAIPESGLSTP